MSARWIIPEVMQSSACDCGPATVKALLGGLGVDADYERLRRACRTEVDGTSIDQIEDLLRELGEAPVDAAPVADARLLVVFLRGAADVLNMVVPHGEEAYYRLRPTLGIARPDDGRKKKEERVVDLDGFFGFHPNMSSLLEAWQSRQLAIIHACGAPDESRSGTECISIQIVDRSADRVFNWNSIAAASPAPTHA